MILNTHPENRKAMVKAICELTGMNAMYLFTPTYAYQVGPITVSRDSSIDCEDEAMLSTIKPMLIERGWLEAETQDEMPTEPESLLIPKRCRIRWKPSALSRWTSPCQSPAGRLHR